MSRDAIEHRITHYTKIATQQCPSLRGKTITAHVLRHTTAMRLLHAGVDTSVIALWLGHESVETTQIYLHADLNIKEKALARTATTDSEQADTAHPTTSSPCSKRSDYADLTHQEPVAPQGFTSGTRHNPVLGIMQFMPNSA